MSRSKYSEYNYARLVSIMSSAPKCKDPEAVACILADRYGNVENILCADYSELCELVGESIAVYLKVLGAVSSRRHTEKLTPGKVHTRAEVAEYFKALFLTESIECVYALLLGEGGETIGCRLISKGTVNSSEIIPRKILEEAIDGGSHRVILAHNHPHGLARASDEDIRLTGCVSDVLSFVGIKLEYHLVVAGTSCDIVSYTVGKAVTDDSYKAASGIFLQ